MLACCLFILWTSLACAEGFTITDTQAETFFFAGEPVEILITAAGDVTFGGNMKENPDSTIYTRALDAHDGDLSYFFANVYDLFFIVINAGRDADIQVGMPMQITRGDQIIARAIVTDVRKKVAGLLVQKQVSSNLVVNVGDRVSVTTND